MQKRWNVLAPPPQDFFDTHPELPKGVATLLYHRNLTTQEQIDEFLHPDYSQDVHDPYLFNDMHKAVDRIFEAFEKNEKITIHGDYDADGVAGSVILHNIFTAMDHSNFDVFLPHRETDGYGLNLNTVQKLHDSGTNLLISCDCGISNKPEVEFANQLGIDVIITDHHSIPAELPPAHAIIHPKIKTENYPDKHLAGGAVAFKLTQAILQKHKKENELLPNGERHEAFEKWLLDMVAISSVADMVPLIGESRTLTKYGLIVLNKTKRTGLQKLYKEIKILNDDGTLTREIDATTIGFKIAPRINAAGRVGHANVAYELLIEDQPSKAIDLAYRLDQNNEERRKLTTTFVDEAITQIEAQQQDWPVLFVFGNDWTTGVVGLIASRLKDRYNKPTIAMAMNKGEVTGSGRSIEGFNMIEALQELPELFAKFGGHPMACGFTLADAAGRDAFREALTKKFKEKTEGIDLTPTLDIDAEVDLDDIDWKFYDVLEKFAPFGQANAEPLYLAKGLTVTKLKPMGKEKKHLTIMVKHNGNRIRKTIGWRLCDENEGDGKDWSKELKIGDMIDMVFKVGVNEWNGNRELQLTIEALRKSDK